MRRTMLAVLAAFLMTTALAFAHGDAEHVRGTVTSVTDTAITVQTTTKQTRTIPITAKTMIMKGEAHLTAKDLKAGDRVVIDVDKKSKMATEIKVGVNDTAAAKPTPKPSGKPKN
jgi:biopolymer transport protein ExbD